MAQTKKVTLYGLLYPGWQNQIFPPGFYPVPPTPYAGTQVVAIEVSLPIIDPDAGTHRATIRPLAPVTPFPAKAVAS